MPKIQKHIGNLKQHHMECKGQKEEKGQGQSGEQEWEGICQRNPLWRLREKSGGGIYETTTGKNQKRRKKRT